MEVSEDVKNRLDEIFSGEGIISWRIKRTDGGWRISVYRITGNAFTPNAQGEHDLELYTQAAQVLGTYGDPKLTMAVHLVHNLTSATIAPEDVPRLRRKFERESRVS
jgi:hypothetical protein